MKANYLIILAIMAVACYFLFVRKPRSKPADDSNNATSNPENDA